MTLSHMRLEAEEASVITQQQCKHYATLMPSILEKVHAFAPTFIVTVGRGSSDHAASFAKYVFETQLGLVTSSAAPSIETIYHSQLSLKGALVVAFSQSGQSSDLCEVLQATKNAGALTIAFVNKTDSPLASIAHHVIPLLAGEEISVAATKSLIATLVAILFFTAHWKEDTVLLDKLSHLSQYFVSHDDTNDWSYAVQDIAQRSDILVLGRGFTFPIAMEAALKLKETCKLHAEAFSSAEVLHGPFALMQDNFPLIVFVPTDGAAKSLPDVLTRLTTISACTYLFVAKDHAQRYVDDSGTRHILALPQSLHPLCDSIVAIQAFYLLAEKCAQYRGINPDKPEHLSKVTSTR